MSCSCVTITIVIPARVDCSRYESQDHGCAGLWPDLGWYVSLTEQTTEGHVHARLTAFRGIAQFCTKQLANRRSDRESFDLTRARVEWVLSIRLLRVLRNRLFGKFLKARIIPQRIEHRIEPEKRGSERHVFGQRTKTRDR